jgi:uncharacterized protein YbjT (DUF2867 family)
MKVVLAGGSGSLGRRIAADLSARGDVVVVLTRSPGPDRPHRQLAWDGVTVGAWAGELQGAALVNRIWPGSWWTAGPRPPTSSC